MFYSQAQRLKTELEAAKSTVSQNKQIDINEPSQPKGTPATSRIDGGDLRRETLAFVGKIRCYSHGYSKPSRRVALNIGKHAGVHQRTNGFYTQRRVHLTIIQNRRQMSHKANSPL